MIRALIYLGLWVAACGLCLTACSDLPTTPDTRPPTIIITSPGNGSTATDTLVVQVNAQDDRGVARVVLLVDGLLDTVAVDETAPYRLVLSLVDLGSGTHTFKAAAIDSAGNSAETTPRSFTAVINPGLKFVGRMTVDGSARDVAVAGNYAFVAAWDGGIVTVDIASKVLPVTLGRYDTDGIANGVRVDGTKLYVADGDEGLLVLDVSNPDSLVELGRFKAAGMNAYEVAVSNGHAFVASGQGGLFAIDVANLDSLKSTGVYDQGGDIRDVEISGDYAYTAEMDQGMRVIDISRPDSMFAVDQYLANGLVGYDIVINGTAAMVAAGNVGLHAVNIADPANIASYDFLNRNNIVQGVVSFGGLTYISSGAAGVEVINSANPANLLTLANGVFNTSGIAYRMDLAGGYLFVADNAQLTILKYVAP